MEIDVVEAGFEEVEKGSSDESFLEGDLGPRSKTSLRMHYEAQVAVIQKQLGNLEEIRGNLGLSQRKISQLLMVDPSSWTRWTRKGDEAPPHIWRALQWYLALNEKLPGLTPQYFITTNPQNLHEKALKELEIERQERTENIDQLNLQMQQFLAEKGALHSEIDVLKKDLKFHKKMSIVILLLSLSWALILLLGNIL